MENLHARFVNELRNPILTPQEALPTIEHIIKTSEESMNAGEEYSHGLFRVALLVKVVFGYKIATGKQIAALEERVKQLENKSHA